MTQEYKNANFDVKACFSANSCSQSAASVDKKERKARSRYPLDAGRTTLMYHPRIKNWLAPSEAQNRIYLNLLAQLILEQRSRFIFSLFIFAITSSYTGGMLNMFSFVCSQNIITFNFYNVKK